MSKFWNWCKSVGPWILGLIVVLVGVLSSGRVTERRRRFDADLDDSRNDENDIRHRIDDATTERNNTVDDIRDRNNRIAELRAALADGSLTSPESVREAEEFLREFAGDQ